MALISYGLWQRRFGGRHDAVGRRLRMAETDRTIIGVLPRDFSFPVFGVDARPDIVFPQRIDRDQALYKSAEMTILGRQKPGVSRAQAQAELQTLVTGWREKLGASEDWGADATVVTLKELIVGDVRPTLLLLFGSVGLILLIATANTANLMLVRALGRQQEVAVRLALGAAPSRRKRLAWATLFPGRGALGRRLYVDMPGEEPAPVVGVVGDIRINGPGEEVPDVVYRPFEQVGATLSAFGAFRRSFLLRLSAEPAGLAEEARRIVRRHDPNAVIDEYETLPAAISATLTARRVTMILLSVFTSAALVLGAVGVYGLMAYSVRARRRELSIRAALGASRGRLLRQVLADALRVAVLGAVFGLVLALSLSRTLESFVFDVATADPWVLGSATLLGIAVALLATFVPALSAGRADPAAALAPD